MRSAFANALNAVLLVLFVVTSAFAVAMPHTSPTGCGECHPAVPNPAGGYSIDLTNTTGLDNTCLTCHTPGGADRAFSPRDVANPFGTTATGVPAAEQMQTSHNWAAPVNVSAAGAATPLDTTMKNLRATQQGVISCASCHEQHSAAGSNLVRYSGNVDLLCFDCHRSRNQRSHLSGTHPVNFTYTSASSKVKKKPSDYNLQPVNANPANPTSAMRLPGGKLVCTTCHGVHFTDSDSSTYDSYSSASLGHLNPSDGSLLRTDLRGDSANAVNICTNCHRNKTAHNNKGQNIQCADCHGGHVDPGDGSSPNVWLVRRFMNYSAGSKIDSYRRTVLNQYTASRSNWAGAKGVCQTCHIVPPPGGSYPTEHASTNPNVCRSCHSHNSAIGSFSADCKGCHGFPPVQNTPAGPLGYASTPYNYAASAAFKDESKTPHGVHAAGAPYSYGCSECHLGNKHATGNFQQVFIAKTGILAATGGAIPSYNTASPGTCLNVYCHSNGAPAGGTTVYKNPVWASSKGTIVGTTGHCNACHEVSPTTSAHPGHLSGGFLCSECHAATVSGNRTISDTSKHVNGLKDVQFSGTATLNGTGSYNAATHTCTNLYCHSNGNKGMLVYANPAAWNSGVSYGCNGCHGTGNSLGAPDYTNGGSGQGNANSHTAHMSGATSTTGCSDCHFITASSTSGGALATNSKHISGSVDVVFNPAVAGATASWDPTTGTCSNVVCHGNAPAQWGSTAGCLTCHSVPIRGRAAIGPQFGGKSHHVQGVTLTGAHCYQCHWEANSDGTINRTYHHSGTPGAPVELVIYGTGVRPTTYTAGTTAIQYTANGTRTEMAKINSHCLGCHSDKNNTATPFGDGKTPKQYAWDGASIGTKYGSTATTQWGKYSGGNTTPKSTVTKALSAHGNAAVNKGGWDTTETWKDRLASVNVVCFDCHNSHGSNVGGTTTSYASATTNGGILKDVVAGQGGYQVSYQPAAGGSAADRNIYNPGAALCFDCHMKSSATTTPWGYNSTFGSTQQIMGYMDSAYFGAGVFGNQLRYAYKASTPNMGGHFGASSSLTSPAMQGIGGLCTPCHDPHGVSPSLGTNMNYAVPLLKGTWVTSPYKEDVATVDNVAYRYMNSSATGDEAPQPAPGTANAYLAAKNSYKIDQNTFASGSITQTDQQFGGLCLKCHPKQSLTNGVTHTWKSKDRIHESVKGWKTANTNIKHTYSCSKCHAVHNTSLPRLMVTNCLDSRHRGQMPYNANAISSGSGTGSKGNGSGRMPGYWAGGRVGDRGGYSTSSSDAPAVTPSPSVGACHEGNDTTQMWNVKTPWGSSAVIAPPTVPVLITEPNATCSGSCATVLQWNASTNTGGAGVQYQVQVSSSSTFATVNFSSGWISGTSYTPTLTSGTWYWRVQARDSVAITRVSAWSTVGSFTLSATTSTNPPTIPVLVTEPNATCSSSCATALQWNASTNPSGNALQYQVQVSSSSTFATVNFSSGWISGTSYTPTLTNGTWYWRVQARDSVATTRVSAWSTVGSFTLSAATSTNPPSAPVLVAEPDGTCSSYSGCSIGLQWNASTNPSGNSLQYQVQVSSSSSFSSIRTSSSWQSGTSWNATVPRGTWYWRVQSRDAAVTTRISPWSSVDSFVLR